MNHPAPLSVTARMIVAGVALLAALVVWAALGTMDVSSIAVGEVIPSGKVKAVQHLEGGIVRHILVHEGQRVGRDQPLMELDPVRADSDYEEIAARVLALQVDMARLEAEVSDLPEPVFPEAVLRDAPQLAKAAHAIYETRQKRLSHEVSTLDNLVAQRQQELRELEVRAANSAKTLGLISSQVAISEEMLKRELTSRMVHLDLVRQMQVLKSQQEADAAALPRVQAALREAEARRAALRETYREQAQKDLAQARQSFEELSQRAARFRNVQERTILKAPVEGLVKSIFSTTEGGVIQPGATAVEIVPVEDRLEIEARLPVQDVGFVHGGQAVRITLHSTDAAIFHPLEGEVLQVAPDAVADKDGRPFYRIRVLTRSNRFTAPGLSYDLYPGMQVACAIQIGHRTVLAYILGPWLHAARFAVEER